MRNKTVFVCLLILSYICASCAMTSTISSVAAGFYVEARKAELKGDYKTALMYYKESMDSVKGSDLGYVPSKYLPAGYTGGSVSRARLEYSVIRDAYQRVYNIDKHNVIEKSKIIEPPATDSQPEFKLKSHITDGNWKTGNIDTKADNEGDSAIPIKESDMLEIHVNKNQPIYKDIIFGVKEYIEKYRIEENKIKLLILEIDYELIISRGKEYIEKYRNISDSKWEEVEKLIKEAETVKRDKDFSAIKNLSIEEDYEFIISRGKEYIEKYRNIAGSNWKEILILVNKAEQRRKQVEEARRRERLREEKRQRERLARCDGEIMTMEQFYRNNNPYADKGKCVDVVAVSFQMFSSNIGLFKISDYSLDLVYIDFKEPFRGRFVKGVAKILGIYTYPTRLGGSNSVPHLKMLEIERVE